MKFVFGFGFGVVGIVLVCLVGFMFWVGVRFGFWGGWVGFAVGVLFVLGLWWFLMLLVIGWFWVMGFDMLWVWFVVFGCLLGVLFCCWFCCWGFCFGYCSFGFGVELVGLFLLVVSLVGVLVTVLGW